MHLLHCDFWLTDFACIRDVVTVFAGMVAFARMGYAGHASGQRDGVQHKAKLHDGYQVLKLTLSSTTGIISTKLCNTTEPNA